MPCLLPPLTHVLGGDHGEGGGRHGRHSRHSPLVAKLPNEERAASKGSPRRRLGPRKRRRLLLLRGRGRRWRRCHWRWRRCPARTVAARAAPAVAPQGVGGGATSLARPLAVAAPQGWLCAKFLVECRARRPPSLFIIQVRLLSHSLPTLPRPERERGRVRAPPHSTA